MNKKQTLAQLQTGTLGVNLYHVTGDATDSDYMVVTRDYYRHQMEWSMAGKDQEDMMKQLFPKIGELGPHDLYHKSYAQVNGLRTALAVVLVYALLLTGFNIGSFIWDFFK